MKYIENPCPVIVIDGGECGGKSTCQPRLFEASIKAGYHPIFLPEVATELFKRNITFRDGSMTVVEFQRLVMMGIVQAEEEAKLAAIYMKKRGKKPVIFCDRGLADSKVFVDEKTYNELLAELGLTHNEVLNKRYDAVLFMVTAADGAEHAYKQSEFRPQTPAEARANDKGYRKVWTGNQHFRLIKNTGSWDHKLDKLEEELLSYLGVPIPIERERKYLIPRSVVQTLGNYVHHHVLLIEQQYIAGPHLKKARIRRMLSEDGTGDIAHFLTKKEDTNDPEERTEVSYRISKDRYVVFSELRIPECRVILKKRHYFLENDLYFELDDFIDPHCLEFPIHKKVPHGEQVAVLEIEMTNKQQDIIMPSWIPWYIDVTDDKRFTNASLAKIKK